MKKTIWIDLDNLPHVQIFRPIYLRLKHKYNIIITARDHAYTIELLELFNIPYFKIGKYFGKNYFLKIIGTFLRAFQLMMLMHNYKCDLAISHGSRSMVIAAKILGIKTITMFDYEHVSNKVFEKFSDVILVPEAVKKLPYFYKNTVYQAYPGFKEEIYIYDFQPEPDFLQQIHVPKDKILAVIRPPAFTAHYHNPEAENIYKKILNEVSKRDDVYAVILPRLKDEPVLSKYDNIRILTKPVSGLNLIYYADLLIGGGGTMNREAAILETPVYSFFMGRKGVLDELLEKKGKLKFLHTENDVERIRWKRKRNKFVEIKFDNKVLSSVIKMIEKAITE